ncbi:MAG: plasmid partition protein ParG [Planctomycetota bacterium]
MSKNDSFPDKPSQQYSPRVTQAYEGLISRQEPTKRVCIDLPQSLHTRIKIGCAQQNVSISQILRDFLEKKFPEVD